LKVFVRYGSDVVKELTDTEFRVEENSRALGFGPEDIKISKKVFKKPGPYVLVARLLDLADLKKLDQKSFTFYVESEPLVTGFFEDMRPFSLEHEEYQYSLGLVEPGTKGGYILSYNVLHPEYEATMDSVETLTEHLFRFSALELAKLDLASSDPRIVEVDETKLDNAEYTLERYLLALGKLFYYYHKGKK
jgi:hypothetical protein